MTTKCFTLVRGRRMRVTRLDDCGRIVFGDDSQAVSKGFVSVALTANTSESDEISVTDADGEVIVLEPSEENLAGYGAEIVFRQVDPELFNVITGQKTYANYSGDIIGLVVNTKIKPKRVALELWAGVHGGDACENPEAQGDYGYMLLPNLKGGIVGDITVENGAINFTIRGARSLDGNYWKQGPYPVMLGGNPVDEVQTVTITGAPTGGTFRLTYGGQQTATIAYNATTAVVTTALEALSNIGVGDVVVTGGPGPATPYVITFAGALADKNIEQMTAQSQLTGGTTPAIAVTTTVGGTIGVPSILPTALNKDDHFLAITVDVAPPEVVCGTRPLLDPTTASLTALGNSVVAQTATFTPTPANIAAPAYYEFGDGEYAYLAAGSLAATTHLYKASGTYTVKATTNNKTVSTTVVIP